MSGKFIRLKHFSAFSNSTKKHKTKDTNTRIQFVFFAEKRKSSHSWWWWWCHHEHKVWPDLAKFSYFGKMGHFRYCFGLVFGKLLYLLWQFLYCWAIFQWWKTAKEEKIIQPSGHTVFHIHWKNGLTLWPSSYSDVHLPLSDLAPVWPDLAIYWTLGNFLKPLATIILPKSPTFSGNF